MNNNEKFEKLINFYRNLHFGHGSRLATLQITDTEQLNLLNSLLDDSNDFALTIISGNLLIGEAVEVEVGNPKIAIGIIATDFNDLLSTRKAKFREPERYFIIDNNFSNSDEVTPDYIAQYRQVIKMINLIKESSAYFDEENGEFIFVDDGKFLLPVRYSVEQIQLTNITAMNQLLDAFNIDTHREQKLAILSKSVHTVCGSVSPNERFGILLTHLVDLQKSFSEGYRLFVADFSYEKIINQLEIAKLEEIGKIHKTFSDIQNQILGIPVATIVVATQMKKATDIGYEFWVNSAVLFGCWVFVILSFFILRNQKHTLMVIEEEIKRKKDKMLAEYNIVADLIMKSFPILERRLKIQWRAFHVVDAILAIGFIAAHVMYFMITSPAQEWFKNIIKYFM